MMAITIEKEKLLLVEGQDECSVFGIMLADLGITDIQIIDCGGNIQLKDKFPSLIKSYGFSDVKSYAIIQDADASFNDSLIRVQSLLKKYGQPVPGSSGVFVQNDSRRVGIYILPGDGVPGMLEDLYLNTLIGTPIIECIDTCVAELQRKCPTTDVKGQFGISKRIAKVRALGTLMATSGLHNRLGLAAKDKYWNLQHPAMASLSAFINQL